MTQLLGCSLLQLLSPCTVNYMLNTFHFCLAINHRILLLRAIIPIHLIHSGFPGMVLNEACIASEELLYWRRYELQNVIFINISKQISRVSNYCMHNILHTLIIYIVVSNTKYFAYCSEQIVSKWMFVCNIVFPFIVS